MSTQTYKHTCLPKEIGTFVYLLKRKKMKIHETKTRMRTSKNEKTNN